MSYNWMVTIESHHHLDCYVSTYDVLVLRESADLLYKLRKARILVKMGSSPFIHYSGSKCDWILAYHEGIFKCSPCMQMPFWVNAALTALKFFASLLMWHKSVNNKKMPISLFCLFWFCAMSKRHIYLIRSKKVPFRCGTEISRARKWPFEN